MVDLLKRHEIQALLGAGHAEQELAPLAGVSVRSVCRIRREALVSHVDDRAEVRRRGVGRPSKTAHVGGLSRVPRKGTASRARTPSRFRLRSTAVTEG